MSNTKKKVGRPPQDKTLKMSDMIDRDGNLGSPYETSKMVQAEKFRKVVENNDANRRSNGRGMYAGMADPESYMEFYRQSISKPKKGRPWTYANAKALQREVTEYFEFAIDNRIPITVAGLGAWLGITVSNLRLWKQNRDTMPFYEVIEPAIAFIHAMTEQGAMDGTVPALPFIFASKNYFGLKDKMEYEIMPTQRITSDEQEEIINTLPIED